jgi:hypothetical protein
MNMTLQMSDHSKYRIAQRNLSTDKISYITTYGQCFHRAGAKIYYLRRRDIPEWDRNNDQLAKLIGTALILTKDGRTLITAWRNQHNGLKHIKQKPDFSSPKDQKYNFNIEEIREMSF